MLKAYNCVGRVILSGCLIAGGLNWAVADQSSSINLDLQAATESILSAGVSEYGADAGCAIVMDAKSGWILAVASAGATNDVPLLTRAQELGSVVAPLAIAAAIESDPAKYGPETAYDTSRDDPRYEKLPSDGGHQWFPTMTLREALAKSSNVVLAKLAWDVGSKTLFDTYSGFGLGSSTGLWGAEESSGFLLDPRRLPWGVMARSRMGIGHGLTATPIQVVSAYQALANKGVRLKPQLSKKSPQELSRPVSPETAAKVLEMMTAVVSEQGTARRAKIEGVKVAGKTGTAMKQIDGVPTPDQRLASFCGIVPADEPKFVAMVLLDFNKEALCHQGGNAAVPIWRKIAIVALGMRN